MTDNMMKNRIKRDTMFGFLCAGCGRCLEELRAWQLGAERFYCGIFCREVDEHLSRLPPDEAGPGTAVP